MTGLLAAFYGDDFTGSAENLAQFRRHGLRCRLYFSATQPDAVFAAAQDLDVVGIAGAARALAPAAMSEEIGPAFALMQRLRPRVMQYKICSTFDSSPTVGSYGRVMALARRYWSDCALPVFPATPAFGRYTAFSNHFTRLGEDICRLDYNPAMAHHPSTPMHESDLRRHLSEQTELPAGALMLTDYAATDGGRQRLRSQLDNGAFVVLDAIDEANVDHVARLIIELTETTPTLAIAAQGLAFGLGRLWTNEGQKSNGTPVPTAFPGVSRLLVLSGSCSPQTQRQLSQLEAAGGVIISLAPESALADPDRAAEGIIDAARRHLGDAEVVAVATTRKGDDIVQHAGGDTLAGAVGDVFARVSRAMREEMEIQRIVFAGGDTSSYSMRKLGADALEIVVFDEVQSSHICRLVSTDPAVDGLEVVLKGGQIGADDFFMRAKTGTTD